MNNVDIERVCETKFLSVITDRVITKMPETI